MPSSTRSIAIEWAQVTVSAEEVTGAMPLIVVEANDVVIVIALERHLQVFEVDAVALACIYPCLFDLADYA